MRHSICIVAVLVLTAGLSRVLAAPASVPEQRFWVPDNGVDAIVARTDVVYLGGAFTHVGPFTGGFTSLDAAGGAADYGMPKFHGIVKAILSDGAGGWFVGGLFRKVGDHSLTNLAHIRSDRTVEVNWSPNADGEVDSLCISGNTIYVGGSFDRIGDQARTNIAALDLATGLPTPWVSNANLPVKALGVLGDVVYAGGTFNQIGGQMRNGLAALDARSGQATDWNPNLLGTFRTDVLALVIDAGVLYAGGTFTSVSGQPRTNLAAFDLTTGLVTDWNPSAIGWRVSALVVANGTAYVGGVFEQIGGLARTNLAALDLASGSVTAWNPSPAGGEGGEVFGLAVAGDRVFVGGEFYTIGGKECRRLAAISAATGQATSWNTYIDGFGVFALGFDGTQLAAGGDFSMVGGVERNGLAALDILSGEATSWNPNVNGFVYTLALTGNTLYAGGRFDSAGGLPRTNLVATDLMTGQVLPWSPNPSGGGFSIIYTLAASSDAIYAGGIFDRIGGRSVENIASLDPITGAARTWFVGGFTSQFGSVVQAIAASGTTVYLGGIFTGVGGMPRESLAAIDAATGTVTDWNPNASFAPSVTAISSLALDTDRLYFSGDFRTVGGLSRTNLAAVDLVQGAATAWNPGADTAVETLVLAAGTVYAGGAFSSIGGATRRGLVELDATSGTVSGWNPNPDSTVEALTISGNLLFVGGGFRSISGEARPRLAAFASSEPALPRIESSSVRRMPDGRIAFQIDAQPGLSVIVQGSSNLVNWLDLQTTNATGASIDFVDSTATNLVRRFYRLQAR